MDPVNYYITTFTNAFKNIAPLIAFAIGGYVLFIKGPFWFLKKSMNEQKKKIDEDNKNLKASEKYTVEDYKAFQRKLKLMYEVKEEPEIHGKSERPKQQGKPKAEKKDPPPGKKTSASASPEELFNFTPGETFSQAELKKRYYDLLKQNHPDRVASMGQDFKKLAEKNTKEINKAFEALKKKAS
jgi:DnaJ domain